MNIHLQLSAVKNYFFGFATSGSILITGLLYFNTTQKDNSFPTQIFTEETNASERIVLKAYDPNSLNKEEWISLGFSEKQATTILKYKQAVGGSFVSKEQLRKCYAISESKYDEIEKYILLPETANRHFRSSRNSYRKTIQFAGYHPYRQKGSDELRIPGKFNPDHFSESDFEKMGFTERQAASILKYKNYLGGSFISKEKFKECFIISEENYRKMEPYLLLPQKTPENYSNQRSSFSNNYAKTEKPKVQYQNFDPNQTDFDGWKNLGFTDKQAQTIINYRDRYLKGSFKSLEEIQKCYAISPEKFEEMRPYIVLNPDSFQKNNVSSTVSNRENPKSQKATASVESKTDFSKTDLNEINFKQLIEYGFDEKSAASFIGFRNKLGGFVNKQQILDTYNIDKVQAQRLIFIAPLTTDNVQKYSLMDAPESWLKNHPYFKYYADKIIYYRISFKNENKFFREMKVKPEAEERMRLYMK